VTETPSAGAGDAPSVPAGAPPASSPALPEAPPSGESKASAILSGRGFIVAAAVVILVAGLRAAAPFLLPLMVAGFLAVLCFPVTRWLLNRGLNQVLAVFLTVLAAALLLGAVGLVVTGAVNEFTQVAPIYAEQLYVRTTTLLAGLEDRGIDVNQYIERFDPTSLVSVGRALVQRTLQGVASFMTFATLVLLILVCLLFEGARFPARVRRAFGGRTGPSDFFARVIRDIKTYLGVKTGASLVTGILVGLWCLVLGVPFALIWALLAFLLNFIPNLGSILAAAPPVLIALVQGGPGKAALVTVGYLAVNFLIGNVAEPMFMGRQFGLATVLVFLSLIFWGWLWGVLGMLLSVPLTMVCKIVLEQYPELDWLVVMISKAPSVGKAGS
jgi:AI-2 transport protein TqsA